MKSMRRIFWDVRATSPLMMILRRISAETENVIHTTERTETGTDTAVGMIGKGAEIETDITGVRGGEGIAITLTTMMTMTMIGITADPAGIAHRGGTGVIHQNREGGKKGVSVAIHHRKIHHK